MDTYGTLATTLLTLVEMEGGTRTYAAEDHDGTRDREGEVAEPEAPMRPAGLLGNQPQHARHDIGCRLSPPFASHCQHLLLKTVGP